MGASVGLSRRAALGAAALAAVRPRRAFAARRLTLGHGLPATHPIQAALESFARRAREASGGSLEIQIFADGQLGQELDLLDQVRAGKLDLMKASATVLERTAPAFNIFNLPFLIRNAAHYRSVVSGPIGESILATPLESRYIGLTFYDAGARSFYGRVPFLHPSDLVGQKIRVQPAPTMVRMIELLGAQPITLAWSLVRGALMAGLVDGAENNLSALSAGGHGEVVRHFSFTQHTFVPDVLLIGTHAWSSLSNAERDALRSAAAQSYEEQARGWTAVEAEARLFAEAIGVTFHNPDKAPFVEKVAPLREQFREDPVTARLAEEIARV